MTTFPDSVHPHVGVSGASASNLPPDFGSVMKVQSNTFGYSRALLFVG